MLYQALADLVVLIHVAFILFALLGGLLALRWHWMPWAHLPAVCWGTAVEIFGWFCPLTPLENSLRRASGAAGYSGGFIERHLLPMIYPAEFTRIPAIPWLRCSRFQLGRLFRSVACISNP